jgi:hypothetical protein
VTSCGRHCDVAAGVGRVERALDVDLPCTAAPPAVSWLAASRN